MKQLWKIMAISVLLLALVACGKKEASAGEKGTGDKEKASAAKVEEIKKKGKLVLGTCADYPPMEWIEYNGKKEEFVGVDIEIAKAIAKELGVQLEIKNMAFEGLINSLNAADVDIVLAGMVASPERKKVVDFTQPYKFDRQVVVVRKGEEGKYKALDDLKGKKIGAQLGTVQFNFVEEKFPGQVTGMDNNNNLIMNLKNKTFDCLFLTDLPAKQFVVANPDLCVVDNIGAPEQDGNAVAVKKGNQDLLQFCDQVVGKLKESGQVEKWINEMVEKSSKTVQQSK